VVAKIDQPISSAQWIQPTRRRGGRLPNQSVIIIIIIH